MKNVCACNLHKERRFLLSLKPKLSVHSFKKLELILEEKWYLKDELVVAKAKLDKTWPVSEYVKPINDMYKMGWIDNLTYAELAAKARKL